MAKVTVQTWSGTEVRALRLALRLTLDGFAAKLGVSTRVVSKWEAGRSAAHPAPVNQEALDTLLSFSEDSIHDRFAVNAGLNFSAGVNPHDRGPTITDGSDVQQSAPLPEETRIQHAGDGKLMALVEAGLFLHGESGKEPAWLERFYIDVYPVTVAEYGRFLAATGHRAPHDWDEGRPPENRLDHPVVFVDWHDANAYATWCKKVLPTALQWEKAARGTRGEPYPWGSRMTPAKCNTRESGIRDTTPVDRYHSGASPYGVYDLCGNVWEWCSTETADGRRQLKGSAFTSPFQRARPSNFNDAAPTMLDDDTGFRCASDQGD